MSIFIVVAVIVVVVVGGGTGDVGGVGGGGGGGGDGGVGGDGDGGGVRGRPVSVEVFCKGPYIQGIKHRLRSACLWLSDLIQVLCG